MDILKNPVQICENSEHLKQGDVCKITIDTVPSKQFSHVSLLAPSPIVPMTDTLV